MSFPSEEQWKPVGTCPICDAELLLMGDKIKWHECIPDYCEQFVTDFQQMVKNVLGVKNDI